MPAVIAIATLAALVWSCLVARRLTIVTVAVATVAMGYVFGHSFWNVRLGPLPVTLDRLLLAVLVGLIAWHAWQGKVLLRRLQLVDWAIVCLLGWLSVSALIANVGTDANLPTSPFFRLIFSFWLPALLYFAIRLTPLTSATNTRILAALSLLGGYLALTALAEVTGQWWAVFPKYIADPTLGTHFGRARGPALNSVSLGIHLTAAFWAAWTLRPRVGRGWQLALIAAMGLMSVAILFTYTRSVWLGVALSGFVMLVAQAPRRWRLPVAVGSLAAGVVLAALCSSFVMNLNREDSGQVSKHSVHQRTAFAYVSWKMFCDEPLTGVGFGRFYDKKLSYLTDRSQPFELESIRPLHHHNTFLSLLTETGMLGLAAYLAMLAGWAVVGARMALGTQSTLATQQTGRLFLAMLAAYLPSAVFHDLSLIFQDQWLLFLIAGIGVASAEQTNTAAGVATNDNAPTRAKQPSLSTLSNQSLTLPRGTMSLTSLTPQISLFGVRIDRVNLDQATSKVADWCLSSQRGRCRYVVTPNVDHAVLLSKRNDLWQAYTNATMVLADGAPIVAAAKLLGRPLPERVAGSDLVPSVLRSAKTQKTPLRVFLLGAGPGVAERAAANIQQQFPNVEVVGTYCPPLGFEHHAHECQAAVDAVAVCKPDLLVVGLGAPKQELWVHKHADQLEAKVALCAGATIDFLAGEKKRSPVWMQRSGLEWLHRLSTEPRRLASRYLRDAIVFPQLVYREWRKGMA